MQFSKYKIILLIKKIKNLILGFWPIQEKEWE